MRPLMLEARGLTVLRDIRLDLTATEGLVAIVGPNGAGKTTLLECLGPAALYREFPSRNAGLKDLATARDARLWLRLEHAGSTWEIEHLIDPSANGGRGKAEAFLTRDGERLTTGRLPDFDAAVARHFPPAAQFYAAAYSPQNGRGNFADLSPSERRDLFASLLGLERWQAMSEEARAAGQRLAADADAREALARGQGSAIQVVDAPAPEAIDAARAELADARARMEAQTAAGIAATARRDLIRSETAAADQLDERRRALSVAAARVSAGRALEAQRGAIEAAVVEVARLQALEASYLSTMQARTKRIEDAKGCLRAASLAERRSAGGLLAARQRARAAQEAAQQAAALRASLGPAPDVQAAREAVDAAREVEATERRTLADLMSRMASAAEAATAARTAASEIAAVPCGGRMLEGIETARCPLIARAAALAPRAGELDAEARDVVRQQRDQGIRARDAGIALAAASDAYVAAEKAQAEHRRAEAEIARLEGLAAGFNEALADVARIEPEHAADEVALNAAEDEWNAAERAPMPDLPDLSGLCAARETAARAADLAAWDASRDLAVDAEGAARAAVEEAEIAAARRGPELVAAQAERDAAVAGYKAAKLDADDAAARLRDLEAQQVRAEESARQSARARDAAVALRAEAQDLRQQAATRELLARSLGRQGLQALEIDCAGPSVAAIVNDLLSACYGTRFSVEIKTLQEAEAGKKQKEVLDLVVYDSRLGYGRPHSTLSGGERVIVDEAVKLGIALFRGRGRFGALFRDEADGALDLSNRRAYPEMLRRALERGGFGSLLYVSHAEESWSQADYRIEVEAGTARAVAR
jgi:exonuclease SbcC